MLVQKSSDGIVNIAEWNFNLEKGIETYKKVYQRLC